MALSIVADFNKQVLIDDACARPACKFSFLVTVPTSYYIVQYTKNKIKNKISKGSCQSL